MAQINFNVSGPIDKFPRITNIDNSTAPIHQHWFLDPAHPTSRLICLVNDNYPVGQGGTIQWQDQSRGFITPPPGAHEATFPPVQPPAPDLPLNIAYRMGRIGRNGDQFVTEFGDVWKFIMDDGFSLFWRYSKGEDISHLLQETKDLGFNGVRVFFAANYGFGKFADLWPTRPDYPWHMIDGFLYLLESYGLYVEMTSGDLQVVCPTLQNQKDYFTRLWGIAKNHVNVGPSEYANESQKNGLQFEVAVKVPGLLLSSGSSLSDSEPPQPILDWTGHHGRRDDVRDPAAMAKCLDSTNLMHVQFGGWGNPVLAGWVPVVSNEGIGAMDNIPEHRRGSRTDVPLYFYRLARMSATFGGATFHNDPGMFGFLKGPRVLECAKAFIQGAKGENV